jgi:hypothetical protein
MICSVRALNRGTGAARGRAYGLKRMVEPWLSRRPKPDGRQERDARGRNVGHAFRTCFLRRPKNFRLPFMHGSVSKVLVGREAKRVRGESGSEVGGRNS